MKPKYFLAVCGALSMAALVVLNGAQDLNKTQRAGGISLLRVPHGGIQPQAVVSGETVHLLYFAGEPKAGDLFYVKSMDSGRSWSTPIRVNSNASSAMAIGTIRGGQLAIGRNGRVHVAWNGSSVSEASGPVNPESGKRGAPMLYSRLNDGGTAFDVQRSLMTRTFGLDGGGSVAADAEGNVYVAWHGKNTTGAAAGEAGRQVWVAISRDDGKTFAAEELAWNRATGACGCCGMAVFADSKGVVRALYRSATENVHRDIYLLTSLDQGRSFEGRKVHTWNINACPMSSMEVIEGAGGVVGAWETGGQVFFERFTGEVSDPVSAPGNVDGRKHPRLALGPRGELLLIWTEGTGWQRGGSLKWQEFDSRRRPMGESGSAAGVPAESFGAVVARPGGFLIVY